tara:strand:+ start:1555 stop:2373 length:819 start_codon:yes stop_codon:yes gene_type:complete
MKHNKKRNTAFIYEALTRELTKTIVNKNALRKDKIVGLMKEYFSAGSILAQELQLYHVLNETTNLQPKLAEKILIETKAAYGRLDEATVFDAQSRLISTINKSLGKEVWANFVPNFKSLASISAIFNTKTAVKKKVLFEQAIVDRMSTEHQLTDSTELKPIDNLAYNSFIQKFNNRYGTLIQEQKDLLNRYITSFADDGFELRLYLNEELSRLKASLDRASKSKLEPLVSQRVDGVIEYLEGFRKREFTEGDLNKVLKTQELVQELATNDHN